MNKVYLLLFSIVTILLNQSFTDSEKSRILYLNSIIPKDITLRSRILTTVSCEDCNDIPKYKNAGRVLSDDQGHYQVMHNGIKILPDLYYGNWMTLIIELLKGHHEPQEEKAFYDVLPYLPENAIMVELGSYWGYYSLWFQKEIPGAVNYLIEPDKKNLVIGKTNFALNGAVGDFTHAMIGRYSANDQPFTNWDYETYLVNQICIDDFVKTKNIPYIHVLHSDIQGAEVDMLEGSKQLIKEKRIGYFFISTHRGTHNKCLNFLKGTDYEILVSITREESFSADGLIIAKSPDITGPKEFNISRRTKEFCKFIDELSNEKNLP